MGDDDIVEDIYCRWVDCVVSTSDLGAYCPQYFGRLVCNRCPTSPQLKDGKSVKQLLAQLRGH